GMVNIISSIDSSASPGTFSVNYRNEPLPLRVTAPGANDLQPRTQASGEAGDLSYAFASFVRRADPAMNIQPDGQTNGPSGAFPGCPLSPTQLAGAPKCPVAEINKWATDCANNGTCVQPGDPYTPM